MISKNEDILIIVEPFAHEQEQSPINVSSPERAGSVAAGMLMIGFGIRRFSWLGLASAAAGVALIVRGVTGRCSVYKSLDINTAQSVRSENSVRGSMTIKESAQELYSLWRNPENFQRIFAHFAQISVTSNESSHWVIRAPLGKTIEWDAWITEERPGEAIRWKASDDSKLPNWGQLTFRQAPGDKGTELVLDLHFDPPGGVFGQKVSDIFGIVPRTIATQALRRFKSLVETGEIPAVEPQPEARGNQGGEYEGALLERD